MPKQANETLEPVEPKIDAASQVDVNQPDEVAGADAAPQEAEPIDMSLQARMRRAKHELDSAVEAQIRINEIVLQKTKALDELIIEENSTVDKNPMNEIQFYLNRQQRKRVENAERKQRMIDQGLDPMAIISQLDTRVPADKKPATRKVDPRSVKTA